MATAAEDTNSAYVGEATYSPEDNKIRIFPFERLDAETYGRLKEAGYTWGRFQGNFVAPMWTPTRWDLALELCGEVGDDSLSTEDRAKQRAERFAWYKSNRHRDAHAAAARVEQMTGGEDMIAGASKNADKAERLARKVDRAMEKAVDQWSRHEYWKERIPAVLAHASYKAQDPVRHRRIKGLEADERRYVKEVETAEKFAQKWNAEGLDSKRAWALANYDRSGAYDVLRAGGEREYLAEAPAEVIEAARQKATRVHDRTVYWFGRWLEHVRVRLVYEREIMAQGGGDMRERYEFEKGGWITCRRSDSPVQIVKVNKAGGRTNSLTCTVSDRDRSWRGSQQIVKVEEVRSYEAPKAGEEAPKEVRVKVLPLCNYPGGKHYAWECVTMTEAEYKAIPERHKKNKDFNAERFSMATHRRRLVWIEDGSTSWGGTHKWVYLSDKKTVLPPEPKKPEPPAPQPVDDMPEPTLAEVMEQIQDRAPVKTAAPETSPTLFDQFKETLKGGGVQVVTADDLYPTPPDLARKAVELAGPRIYGARVLEPSAGTGAIVKAIQDYATGSDNVRITAIESNYGLVQQLEARRDKAVGANGNNYDIQHADFLDTTLEEMGTFGVVVMNPPFSKGADIKHIEHALTMLKPGGRLVAICANGPRQRAAFMDRATHWEELPAGTFKAAGTMVNTALFMIES